MHNSPRLDISKNQILAALSDEESKRLLPHLRWVSLRRNQIVFNSDDPVLYLYFPQDAAVSLLTSMKDGKEVEVSLIGAEGLVGISAVLGAKTYWHRAVVPVAGGCLRIKTDLFQREFKSGGPLQDRVHRYARSLLAQVSQTAACNRVHRLEQRLARWLLMTHDRVKRDEFRATHEFLAHMLGTERSDVTVAAGILRSSGLISYTRGKITILDRKGLESASCECYQTIHDELTHPAKAILHRGSRQRKTFY